MAQIGKPSPKPFSYGGQAVIEGVMMRGANTAAIAVRDPQGKIVVHEEALNPAIYRGSISKKPFLRGLIGLWDALVLGTRSLMWSADVAMGEEDISFTGPVGWTTMAISLMFSIGLFFILPTVLTTGAGNLLGLNEPAAIVETLPGGETVVETPENTTVDNTPAATPGDSTVSQPVRHFLLNLIEGAVRLSLIVGYIALIGLMPDVKRLFGYHGAEHKTINAYEAGAELTPEIVAQYPIEHPRCGTAFLLTVVVVSVLLFSVLGRPPLPLLILSRILFIPVVAGIAYELIRFTARNLHNPIIRVLIIPNLALQHLTTRQPDLTMIEVAIVAFKRVLVSEQVMTEAEANMPETVIMAPTAAGD